MSGNSIVTSEETPVSREPEKLHEGLRSHVEVEVVYLNVVAEHHQLPNPGECFHGIEDMEWDPETFILEEFFFGF